QQNLHDHATAESVSETNTELAARVKSSCQDAYLRSLPDRLECRDRRQAEPRPTPSGKVGRSDASCADREMAGAAGVGLGAVALVELEDLVGRAVGEQPAGVEPDGAGAVVADRLGVVGDHQHGGAGGVEA